MNTVAHHGRKTAYTRTEGEGPTLCCIHGSGGTQALWKSQQARLENPVVALDLAGHGDSPDVVAEAGPEARRVYIQDTLAVADAVDADVLVGNSLGGAVALEAALDYELAVEALVLVGSGAKLGVTAALREWLATDWDRAVEFLHEPNLLLHDPDERLLTTSMAAMRQVGQTVTERDFLSCHAFDVRDRLSAVDLPVLACTGEYDELTPPWFHTALADGVAAGRAALVPGAAHLSMLERPDHVNRLLAGFADAVVG